MPPPPNVRWRLALAQTPGFVERTLDETLGVQISYDGDGLTAGLTLGSLFGALVNWRNLNVEYNSFWKVGSRVFLACLMARRRVGGGGWRWNGFGFLKWGG